MDEIRRRIKRLRKGQTVHCPDCGFGFPVTDEGTADTMEKLLAVYEAAQWFSIHTPSSHIAGLIQRTRYEVLQDKITAVQTKELNDD